MNDLVQAELLKVNMAARLTGFLQRSGDFVKKYATIAWRDHINKGNKSEITYLNE